MHSPLPYRAIRYAVGVLTLSLILRTWVAMGLVEPVTVSGTSMEPAVPEGSRLVIDRAVLLQTLDRWQVIVLRSPVDGQLAVKRVVGLPGERIDLREGKLIVNGKIEHHPLSKKRTWHRRVGDQPPEVYYTPRAAGQPLRPGPWELSETEIFVLGDNSPVSIDSRLWGPVPARLVLGVPLGVR
ncbi:MAG: signal peptidase I [Lacipirellulaceae bacterium]